MRVDQDEIIEKFLKKGAWQHHYLTREWGEWIDKGLEQDSSIAYLWQQKALPFWKQKKYSQAIQFYNRAVALDRKEWLSRLGYLKCIFAKDYESAMDDLIAYRDEFGSVLEQDHSIELYLGICYLQLNRYEEALSIIQESILNEEEAHGSNWVHYLDRFYLAIAFYELGDFNSAILELDKVLEEYPTFSDAQYYKGLCLKRLFKLYEGKALLSQGKLNYKRGLSFNEDASKYEVFPYQVTWQWDVHEHLLR